MPTPGVRTVVALSHASAGRAHEQTARALEWAAAMAAGTEAGLEQFYRRAADAEFELARVEYRLAASYDDTVDRATLDEPPVATGAPRGLGPSPPAAG